MKITEIFYSLQGEGRLAGRPSVFIRLSGCPLRCKWCDTKYAWHSDCGQSLSIEQITERVQSYNCSDVVITGGEPFTNPDFAQLVKALDGVCRHITVETAGICFTPQLPIDLVSLSPKLANSVPPQPDFAALHETNRLNIAALSAFLRQYRCQIKFVVEGENDIDEIKTVLAKCGYDGTAEVMLMPQAADTDDYIAKSRKIADICLENGFSFSPRLHVLLWGNKRGV